jgi:hypothetical protein
LFAHKSFSVPLDAAAIASEPSPGLKDTVVLIIRHAEKPEEGAELSPTGQQRAIAYVNYFKNFTVNSKPLRPDYLVATADSEKSRRPRLTLLPLAQDLGLTIDNHVKNKNFANEVEDLRTTHHGKCVLIAWHHEKIPDLIEGLGADPNKLFPGGKWPSGIFNWVIELHYDHEGRLIPSECKRINEKLLPGDSD